MALVGILLIPHHVLIENELREALDSRANRSWGHPAQVVFLRLHP